MNFSDDAQLSDVMLCYRTIRDVYIRLATESNMEVKVASFRWVVVNKAFFLEWKIKLFNLG